MGGWWCRLSVLLRQVVSGAVSGVRDHHQLSVCLPSSLPQCRSKTYGTGILLKSLELGNTYILTEVDFTQIC